MLPIIKRLKDVESRERFPASELSDNVLFCMMAQGCLGDLPSIGAPEYRRAPIGAVVLSKPSEASDSKETRRLVAGSPECQVPRHQPPPN